MTFGELLDALTRPWLEINFKKSWSKLVAGVSLPRPSRREAVVEAARFSGELYTASMLTSLRDRPSDLAWSWPSSVRLERSSRPWIRRSLLKLLRP
jgi:hypothetical protein